MKGVLNMKSRHLVLALVLSCSLIGTVSAGTKTTNLGSVKNGDFGIVDNAFFAPQTFADTINFTLTNTSTISGVFLPIRLLDAGFSLWSSTAGQLATGVLGFGRYCFADLAPGSYSVSIFGSSRAFGAYAATYRVAVAAVPELETWLMMIIGAALLAYQLHRKHRSLGPQLLRDDAPTPA